MTKKNEAAGAAPPVDMIRLWLVIVTAGVMVVSLERVLFGL